MQNEAKNRVKWLKMHSRRSPWSHRGPSWTTPGPCQDHLSILPAACTLSSPRFHRVPSPTASGPPQDHARTTSTFCQPPALSAVVPQFSQGRARTAPRLRIRILSHLKKEKQIGNSYLIHYTQSFHPGDNPKDREVKENTSLCQIWQAKTEIER